MLGVPRNRLERRGNGLKQQTIELTRMWQREGAEPSREGKDHMAVGDVEALALPRREPRGLGTTWTLGAVSIAARVIADLLMPALIALGLIAAQHGRTALPKRLEDATLRRRCAGTIAGEIGRPILPDDISDFQRRARHGWPSHVAGSGNVSSGLGIAARAWGLTWRE
jgi:hypothetical protein